MTLWESTARRMLGGERPPWSSPRPATAASRPTPGKRTRSSTSSSRAICSPPTPCRRWWASCTGWTTRSAAASLSIPASSPTRWRPPISRSPIPEVLKATIASNGENLVKGLDNLLADIERGQGELSIRQSADGFVIGENVATAPGKVVFRNEIMELLQYSPTTDEVHERPLLIFPPWINKFYIIDLRPENSFVRWLVGQGYTVFLVSWVNPGRRPRPEGLRGLHAGRHLRRPGRGGEGHRRARSQLCRLLHRRHPAGRHPRLHGGQGRRPHPFGHLLGRPDRFQRGRRTVGVRGRSPARRPEAEDGQRGRRAARLQDGRAPSTCCAPTT